MSYSIVYICHIFFIHSYFSFSFFFLAALGLHCGTQAYLVVVSGLQSVGSVVGGLGLSSSGTRATEHAASVGLVAPRHVGS